MKKILYLMLFVPGLLIAQTETNNTREVRRGALNDSRATHSVNQTILKANNYYDSINDLRTGITAGASLDADTAADQRVDINANTVQNAIDLTQLQDSLGWFNVVSYGAVPGGGDDSEAFNDAITAAENDPYGFGNVVYVPAGTWTIADTIILKSYVHILAHKNASINPSSSYDGPIYYSGNEGGLQRCFVTGGRYWSSRYVNTFIEIDKTTAISAKTSRFTDISVTGFNIFLDIETASSGWCNGLAIDNVRVWNTKIFLKTREGGGSAGIDGHFFSNIEYNSSDSTEIVIDSLSGSWNMFSNFMIWDFTEVGKADRKTIVLDASSSGNTIWGGDLDIDTFFVDNGTDNFAYSNGQFYTAASDSMTIYGKPLPVDRANENKLIIGHNGDGGSEGSPAGAVGLRLDPEMSSETTRGWYMTADIQAKSESASNGSSHLYFRVHDNSFTESEATMIEALYLDGSEDGRATFSGGINFGADAQGDDDYEIDIPNVKALSAGLTVTFTANTANTDAATLEITTVGDLDAILKLSDQALATGDIEAGQVVICVFDGSNWQMTSQLAQ